MQCDAVCCSVVQGGAVCSSVAYLSVCLSICLSIGLSVCFSVYLSVCLSVYLSVCLSIHPSACLSVYLSVWLSYSGQKNIPFTHPPPFASLSVPAILWLFPWTVCTL